MSGHTTELWAYTVRVRVTRARPGTSRATPVQNSKVQYSTVQYSLGQYSTVQYSTVHTPAQLSPVLSSLQPRHCSGGVLQQIFQF